MRAESVLLLSCPESSVTLHHMRAAEICGAACCVFMFFLRKTWFVECLGQLTGLSRPYRNEDILNLLSFIGLTLKMELSEELSRCVPKLVP